MWGEGMGGLVRRCGLFRPGRAAVALVAIMALRALIDDVVRAFSGAAFGNMFYDPGDRYADFMKVAMSYRFIVADAVRSHAWVHWPRIFQTYLLANDYNDSVALLSDVRTAALGNMHLPPLATLIYISCAHVIVALGATPALLLYSGAYVAAALAASLLFARLTGAPREHGLFAAFALCLAFPAVWMLNRSNLAGGYETILAFIYLITVTTGRWRPLGWVALALAVNLRPEPALLALLELGGEASLPRKLMRMVIPGLLTLGVFVAAFWAAHALYPAYTLEHVRAGVQIYHRIYIEGGAGDQWNASLLMIPKIVRMALGLKPAASPLIITLVGLAAGAVLLAGAWLAFTGRIRRVEWLFLLAALPAISVPVFAYYHMIKIGLVLLFLMLSLERTEPEADDLRFTLIALCGLAISPLGEAYTNGLADALLLLFGCALIISRGLRARSAEAHPALAPSEAAL